MATKRRKNSKPKPKADTIAASGERTINLAFELPPEMRLLYVDNVNVIHTPSEFTISFMQAQPPLVVTDTDLDEVVNVRSVCVARVVVNPIKWSMILRVLSENYKQYVDRYIQPPEDNGNNNSKTKDDNSG